MKEKLPSPEGESGFSLMESFPNKEESRKFLKSLLAYKNPNLIRYEHLIKKLEERQRGVNFFSKHDELNSFFRVPTPQKFFGFIWWSRTERPEQKNFKIRRYFREKLRGRILVDLGGDIRGTFPMPQVAASAEASAYINVNKYINKKYKVDLYTNIGPQDELIEREGQYQGQPLSSPLRIYNIQADMLDFIARLPDNSVCITINGIDQFIIPDEDYHRALAREIERVVPSGGIVFGSGAYPLEKLSQKRFRSIVDLEIPAEEEGGRKDIVIKNQIFEKAGK